MHLINSNLALAALLFAGLATVHATPLTFSDTDIFNKVLSKGANKATNGVFNIIAPDKTDEPGSFNFDPATMTITTAKAWFDFKDATSGDEEQVIIDLGSQANWMTGPVVVNFFSIGGNIEGNLYVELQKSGILNYRVEKSGESRSVTFVQATLSVEAKLNPVIGKFANPLPDGSNALSLLGFGVVGIASLRRTLK